jgi:hypothetical protein
LEAVLSIDVPAGVSARISVIRGSFFNSKSLRGAKKSAVGSTRWAGLRQSEQVSKRQKTREIAVFGVGE